MAEESEQQETEREETIEDLDVPEDLSEETKGGTLNKCAQEG